MNENLKSFLDPVNIYLKHCMIYIPLLNSWWFRWPSLRKLRRVKCKKSNWRCRIGQSEHWWVCMKWWWGIFLRIQSSGLIIRVFELCVFKVILGYWWPLHPIYIITTAGINQLRRIYIYNVWIYLLSQLRFWSQESKFVCVLSPLTST